MDQIDKDLPPEDPAQQEDIPALQEDAPLEDEDDEDSEPMDLPKKPHLKIAMISWESLHSVAVGGVAAHVTELAAALERRGHEVHVFVRIGAFQKPYELIHGVHYHRCTIQLNPDFVTEMDLMGNSLMWTIGETEAYQGRAFDIVHGHDWMTAKGLVQAKFGGTRTCIFTMHSTEWGRCGNVHYPHGQSARIRQFEGEGCHTADRVICVSGALCDEVKAQYHVPHDKLRCIYNGINVHRYDGFIDPAAVKGSWGIGALDPTVLFVGRMARQKGPDLLLDAIPEILGQRGDAKFVFVGDGHMKGDLESAAHHKGIKHAVRFLGSMGNSDPRLIDLYKACDVVCVPSRNEPFGIVLLEAWAAGKPIVATRQGGPGEIITHNTDGFLTDIHPAALAYWTKQIFNNFAHARWMGEQGRKKAETIFSWDRIAEHTEGVYKEFRQPHF
mmetsp:Transcript_26452/g.45535  ORF Transcript_26452/g.45535 Transcript_26452/m.45535 type:complete len:442 (+) Transcript_26452:76-1401(+)